MQFTITASSSALFSTWIFVEELRLLFDAGDGVSAALMQRSRKIKHVFITHADRDHLCGLLQFHELNAENGVPEICYPADCGSFPALRDFMGRFDPLSGPATWKGLRPGDVVDIGSGFFVEARKSAHVDTVGSESKALDYTVRRMVRHLREEFKGVPGSRLAEIRNERGEDAITEATFDYLLGYSGDAPSLDPEHWTGVRVLIHECTFLDGATSRGAHSDLPQVISAAAQLDLEALLLVHFSTRYDSKEITGAVVAEAKKVRPQFPIFIVLPGEITHDVLSGTPVWEP